MFGIQLYTLRETIHADLPGVLTRLADIGYTSVEPFQDLDYQAVLPLLNDLGLQVNSLHSSLPEAADDPVFAAAAAYGATTIVNAYQPPEHFTSVAAIKRIAERINTANALVQEQGYRLAYHNHDFEFVMVEGRRAYDIFLEYLDPAVLLEVDVYWVQVGGVDPAALLGELGARAPLLHIKDGSGKKDDPMTAVGDGVVDIPAVLRAAQPDAALIVELDRCATDMMEAVAKSYTYLKGLHNAG